MDTIFTDVVYFDIIAKLQYQNVNEEQPIVRNEVIYKCKFIKQEDSDVEREKGRTLYSVNDLYSFFKVLEEDVDFLHDGLFRDRDLEDTILRDSQGLRIPRAIYISGNERKLFVLPYRSSKDLDAFTHSLNDSKPSLIEYLTRHCKDAGLRKDELLIHSIIIGEEGIEQTASSSGVSAISLSFDIDIQYDCECRIDKKG